MATVMHQALLALLSSCPLLTSSLNLVKIHYGMGLLKPMCQSEEKEDKV